MDNNQKQLYIDLLEKLAHGIDPYKEEPLPPGNPYHHPDITRALFFAITHLKSSERPNRGKPWSDEEDAQLSCYFNNGLTITQLSGKHGRTRGAIRSRLIKLGLSESS